MRLADKNYIDFEKGDNNAFVRMYREYFHRLLHYAEKIVGDSADAEDACTEVFVKLWERREMERRAGKIPGIINIESYLYMAVRNSCLSLIRDRQKSERDQKEFDYLELTLRNDYPFHDVVAVYIENLQKEIAALPEQRRRVIELCYFQGLTNEEIAKKLAITVQSVYNLKNKALQQLRLPATKSKINKIYSVSVIIILLVPLSIHFSKLW